MYREFSNKTFIKNTKGLNLEKKSNGAVLYISALAKENGDNKTAGDFIITNKFEDLDIKKLADKIAEEVISKLGGKPCDSKEYETVLGNDAASSLLSTMKNIFSADLVQKGKSMLKDKLNTKIASELVTLVDDPFREGSLNSCAFSSATAA